MNPFLPFLARNASAFPSMDGLEGLEENPMAGLGGPLGNEMDAYAPTESPEELEALLDRITAQAEADYDAKHPGLREYGDRQAENPMGRSFFTTEANLLEPEIAQHADQTLGGSWGNAFGTMGDSRMGDAPSDPEMRRLMGLDGYEEVTTQAPGRPGLRTTQMRRGSGEQVFGGNSTVRNIGGRNMFVDRGAGGEPGAAGVAGSGGIPVPEGGYLTEREKKIMAKLTDPNGMPDLERHREARKLEPMAGGGIDQWEYDTQGQMVRDRLGNPIMNPEVKAKREAYLAERAQAEQEGRDVSRRNYQLQKAGLRAIPLPDHMIERFQAENERIAGGDPLGREKLHLAAQEGQADRASREKIASMEAQSRNPNDLERKARIGIAMQAIESGQMTPEEGMAFINPPTAQGAPGEVPTPPTANGGAAVKRPVPPWAREGGQPKGNPLSPEAIVKAGRAQGLSDEEIETVLKQVTGNSYADIADPDGITAKDWIFSFPSPALPGYMAGQAAQGEFPRHPLARVLGIQD